jgi:hypothetical protein
MILVHDVTATVNSDSSEEEDDEVQSALTPPAYPTFFKEPKLCKVSVQLPDGRLAQRYFSSSQPIQVTNVVL